MKRTFRITVKINPEIMDQRLKAGLEPGVIHQEDIEFDLPEETFDGPIFFNRLLKERDRIMRECTSTRVEEIKTPRPPKIQCGKLFGKRGW